MSTYKPLEQRLWLDGLDCIILGGVSIEDFTTILKTDQETAWKMLQELSQHDIGRFDGAISEFIEGDKLRAAMFTLEKGIPVDDVAKRLSWRDFEGLAAQILESKDFAIKRNLVLREPRMEIDVVGIKLGVAMLVDCKHWKRHSKASLQNAVDKQIERTKHYVAKTKNTMAAPIIVTLYQNEVNFIRNVPIVPIFQFSAFIDEFYGNLEDIKIIRKESQ
jgi:Holliday junction resolvase-like predicted endonuclease